jgi:hypothetical protein
LISSELDRVLETKIFLLPRKFELNESTELIQFQLGIAAENSVEDTPI